MVHIEKKNKIRLLTKGPPIEIAGHKSGVEMLKTL